MYEPVSSSDLDSSSKESLLDAEFRETYQPIHKNRLSRVFQLILWVSICLNITLSLYIFSNQDDQGDQAVVEVSRFAGLTRTIPLKWEALDGHNETEEEELWANTRYDAGQVALDDDYARGMGLPRAQRFPWDPTKGVYLLTGYHNLHCVKLLRTTLLEYRSNEELTWSWPHVNHCLLVLREQVICDANDIPRYTGYQPKGKSGLGQEHMCRDWNQLESWATEHSACWKRIDDIDPNGSQLAAYRFCPPGSPYAEIAKTKWLPETSAKE